ncbi:unnamed protein product [Soboliphyme baturini]|uniref:PPM-type phosphatase domain-containing protein n=1 Tax=Soboliphyme baturini TaxID=241478 RepID=A0A183J1Q6_9BILA|nr:unnamed protein product [Soboliphyme baturini]
MFTAVERGYFVSIGDVLAKRAELLIKIPENMNAYESTKKFPQEMSLINQLGERVSSGCAIVLALVKKDKLFIANVGCGNELVVQQLSVDHDIDNPDEVMRLTKLGLNLDAIRHFSHTTRCLGDFPRKGGYKDFELLSCAKSEPVISDPAFSSGITIGKSFCFLLLMSSGVYLNLENATGTMQVNEDIAYMVAREFCRQSTETSVAQAVLDEIGRIHQNAFLNVEMRSPFCHKREDMTLLVRRFDGEFSSSDSGGFLPRRCQTYSDVLQNVNTLTPSTDLSFDSSNSEEYELPLNENGDLEPYVDFSDYYSTASTNTEQIKALEEAMKDL